MAAEHFKYVSSTKHLREVQDFLMEVTETTILVNAVRVIKKKLKQLDFYKESVDSFVEFMNCDNFYNSMKSLNKKLSDLQKLKDTLAEIQNITGGKNIEDTLKILNNRFLKEYPDWLDVPSPTWKGKEKDYSNRWHRDCKRAYKKLLFWAEANPDDEERIIEEAKLTYLCSSAKIFISSCEKLYILARVEEQEELERKYRNLKKSGGDPEKAFNYRVAKVVANRRKDKQNQNETSAKEKAIDNNYVNEYINSYADDDDDDDDDDSDY